MAGLPGRGGQNRLSIDELQRRGTLRPGRHLSIKPSLPAPAAASEADRAAALKGLSPSARALAEKVLEQFHGWDEAGLRTLRSYALSCERLQTLERAGDSTPTLERELKMNLQCLRALNLEASR